MKLVVQIRLLPDAGQSEALLAYMRAFNAAATHAARVGFDAGVSCQPAIHGRCYRELRDTFGVSSQTAVRAIGKAVECFARDKTVCPVFAPLGAVTYDQRTFSFKGIDRVSLLTMGGRIIVPYILGEYQRGRLHALKGQADLVYRDGMFFLHCTADIPEPPPIAVTEFLGVDLGIVQIAVDSTGESFSGQAIDQNRKRRATARKQYQRKGTKAAKRRLKKMSGRQSRFQKWVNHGISKRLVEKAKTLGVGISLEDLKGIRTRVEPTVGTRFRRRFGNWSFSGLRLCIEYKARLAGVPVVIVDPRNSSRTCSKCGHCEKSNRKSQSVFKCKQCGFSRPAITSASTGLKMQNMHDSRGIPRS
jgi:IS605 OrfB family transposase